MILPRILHDAWRRLKRSTEGIYGHGSFWPISSGFVLCIFLLYYFLGDQGSKEPLFPDMRYPGSSIRILYIEPGSGRDWIYGSLKPVALAERPEYDAVSYSWGEPTDKKKIYVNGNKIEITKNLHNALVNLRHRSKTVALWVDQICINQANLEEKSSQIPLMTTIYSRARSVRLWMGNHLAPRWAENADGLDWSGDWAVAHAAQYPASAKYWLYRLAEEEYWKRTWVIQELAMASNIHVHFGARHPIPWDSFIRLIEWYRQEDLVAEVHRILRLDALRKTMYQDRVTFELADLLTTFYDSFATVQHDKIYAFVGMANQCRDGCIDVNYNNTLYQVYEDVMLTLSESSDNPLQTQIRTLHDASVIRQSLARGSRKVPKKLKYPGKAADPHSYYYQTCGDEKAVLCSSEMDPSGNISYNAGLNDAGWDALSWLFSFIWRKPVRYTMIALPMGTESNDMWLPQEDEEELANNIFKIRGIVAGTVGHIGPSLSAFLEDPRVAARWAKEIDVYPTNRDRRRARGVNERFMNLLSVSPYALIMRAGPLQLPTEGGREDDPNLFLGSTVMAGLLPANARLDDLIIQFWGSNSVLVVRNGTDGHHDFIGRALIVKDDDFDWDSPRDSEFFQGDSSPAIDLEVSFANLTLLSLDGVQLDGS
ncbi:heterokaryon incompatibility protein-domain-containing protein [Ilyonectria destructans]|nr:heterokaryon incompatibility protein-domain-containing protein [Ilyonectria destructans]